jgi:hypothetical protein
MAPDYRLSRRGGHLPPERSKEGQMRGKYAAYFLGRLRIFRAEDALIERLSLCQTTHTIGTGTANGWLPVPEGGFGSSIGQGETTQ